MEKKEDYKNYAIYELTEEEVKYFGTKGKYAVIRNYSDIGLKNIVASSKDYFEVVQLMALFADNK